MELITEIMVFSLIPLIAMTLGGSIGVLFDIKSKVRSALLHLAAGVIFAVVAIELLPTIMTKQNISSTSIGFFLGFLVMMLIKYLSRKSETKHKEHIKTESDTRVTKIILPWGLLFGIAVDLIIDGILLGVGFVTGKSEGILLCIALSIEVLALGMVIAAELKLENINKKRILIIISLLSLTFVIGAFLGSVILSIVSANALNAILSFGLSALIYLVTEELLVEAHETKDTPISTAIFFIGFFIFLLIAIIN